MKVLVTGASGFIGSFIVERALELGYDVWAGIRPSSNLKWLADKRINKIYLDLNNPEALMKSLQDFKEQHGYWDYVVHAAGATKARNEAEFFKINTEGTKLLVDTLHRSEMVPQKLVYLSSLSIMGAIKQQPVSTTPDGFHYEMMKDTDVPQPNTAYGKSKWAAEQYLQTQKGWLPFTILRPTGVYGPREKDYFLMAKSISQHTDFSVGYQPQEITFIYVKDLVEAVFQSFNRGERGKAYFLSDGQTYESRSFSDLLQKEMGTKGVMHVKAPLWVLKLVCNVGEWTSQRSRKLSVFNKDKYKILQQRNWRCDITPAIQELGYGPQYDLQTGVRQTVEFYKIEKWI